MNLQILQGFFGIFLLVVTYDQVREIINITGAYMLIAFFLGMPSLATTEIRITAYKVFVALAAILILFTSDPEPIIWPVIVPLMMLLGCLFEIGLKVLSGPIDSLLDYIFR